MARILAIAAMDEGRVIGAENSIPWHLPEDLKHFSDLTSGHAVLMGRKTFESLPERFRPLPNRKNVVVTRTPETLADYGTDLELCTSPLAYLEQVRSGERELSSGQLWVIGGEAIYRLTLPFWDELHLTVVHAQHKGDSFFPEFEQDFELIDQVDCSSSSFLHYRRAR